MGTTDGASDLLHSLSTTDTEVDVRSHGFLKENAVCFASVKAISASGMYTEYSELMYI